MEKKEFLLKMDTKILYGIAVLMMLYHHLFCIPERLNDRFISVLNISEYPFEMKLAWLCKLCVAVYAFISGYGLYHTCHKLHQNNISEILLTDYKKVIKHLWGFYLKYWLVFLVFVPIGFVYFGRTFDKKTFFLSFIGESCAYNGEWWYVKQYIKMLFLFPLMDFLVNVIENFIKKKKYIFFIIGLAVVISVCYFQIPEFGLELNFLFEKCGGVYTLIFFEGYLMAKYNLFTRLTEWLRYRWIKNIAAISGLFIAGIIRNHYTLSPDYAGLDWFLAPIFLYCIVVLIHENPIRDFFKNILAYFGEHSTYIWLTHTFFAYYYFQNLILLPRYSVLIYLWLVVISLLTSIILSGIYHILEKLKCQFMRELGNA